MLLGQPYLSYSQESETDRQTWKNMEVEKTEEKAGMGGALPL